MHRIVVLLAVAACDLTPAAKLAQDAGSAAPPAPVASTRPALVVAKPVAVAAAPPPVLLYGPAPRPPAPQLVVAAPTQQMRALAVTEDGTAAVSVDVAGSVRLWPALDGTREPVVMAMRRPIA